MSEKKEPTLEEQLANLQAENKDKIAEFEALKADYNAKLADLEKIKADAAKKDELISGLNEEIAKKETENAKLSKKATVKVGKETYELAMKKCVYLRNGEKVEITKEVLDADPELAKELVAKNNGVLIKKA